MEATFITPEASLISIIIFNEGKKYICKIWLIEELIQAQLFLDNHLKYKGNIFLEKIQSQIKAFFDYNIYEIYDEINQLNSNNFSIIKENHKCKLKIEFIILKKKRNIIIDLKDNNLTEKKLNDDIINNYENIIKEKENIIFALKEKIKTLEEKLNAKEKEKEKETVKENKDNINSNSYSNFNISTKIPRYKLKCHTDSILCLVLLYDGRLVSSSGEDINIYNKITYQPDLIIKQHNDTVFCLTVLKSGLLASCSWDNTIKLFNIKGNNYKIFQTLNYHTNPVYKILELKNKYLISCSADKTILFYFKNSTRYQNVNKINTKGACSSLIQTKENEICYSEYINDNKNIICFYDLNERKIKSSLSNISCNNSFFRTFNMITEELLVIGGENIISILNVYQYKLIRVIEVYNSNFTGYCYLTENTFLTGDHRGIIRQWKIEGDNLILISKKAIITTYIR